MSHEQRPDGALTPEDLDRIAAFLEGRASDLERKQVATLLEQSEAAREIVTESAIALGLDEERPEDLAPDPPVRVARSLAWRWLLPLAAAGVAAVAFWPSNRGDLNHQWIAVLSAPPTPAPYSLPTMRGSDDASPSTAARVGVRWLDVRLAAAAQNSALVDSLTGLLIEDLRTVPGSTPVIGQLEALTGTLESVEAAHRGLTDLLGAQVEVGMALEALRLATARGDRSLVTMILDDDGVYEALDRALGTDPTWIAVDVRGAGAATLDLDELNRLTESALSDILRP